MQQDFGTLVPRTEVPQQQLTDLGRFQANWAAWLRCCAASPWPVRPCCGEGGLVVQQIDPLQEWHQRRLVGRIRAVGVAARSGPGPRSVPRSTGAVPSGNTRSSPCLHALRLNCGISVKHLLPQLPRPGRSRGTRNLYMACDGEVPRWSPSRDRRRMHHMAAYVRKRVELQRITQIGP